MRAETNSTVSAGSMPLRQAQPASRSRQLCRRCPRRGGGRLRSWDRTSPRGGSSRGFPEQGAGAFQRQEGVHVFDDGVGRHDDGGRFIVPFFLHALEFHGKGVFRVDAGRDGYGANASGHAERRRAGFRAEMPGRSSRTCPIASGSRSSGHAHRRQLLPDHETYTGSSGLTASSMCCHPAVFPAGDGVGQRGIHELAASAAGDEGEPVAVVQDATARHGPR